MPEVCTLLLDPYGPVRDAASDCLAALLEPVKAQSALMKAAEDSRRSKQEAEAAAQLRKEGPKVAEITKGSTAKAAAPAAAAAFQSTDRQEGLSEGGARPEMKLAAATKLKVTDIPGANSLGFKTPSDSAFWDEIDDGNPLADASTMAAPAPSSGWEDGWGENAAWGSDDGLGDLDDDDHDESSSTPASNASGTGNGNVSGGGGSAPGGGGDGLSGALFKVPAASTDAPIPAKKSVEERRLEAKKRKEDRLAAAAAKMPAEKAGGASDDWGW